MMDYHELIDALTDEDNPNVLDYINDAVEMLEHLCSVLRAANARCETLSKMVMQYQDELIPGYRERAEKAEAQLSQYTASGLEPCDYAAMRSAIDGEKNAKQSLSEALRALAESNARAEKAERERDAAVSDMEALMWYSGEGCKICAHSKEVHKEPCVRLDCDLKEHGKLLECIPKWRGPQEE